MAGFGALERVSVTEYASTKSLARLRTPKSTRAEQVAQAGGVRHAPSLRLRRVKRAPPFRSNLALDNLARVRGRPLDAAVALLIPLGLLLILDQARLGFALGEGPVGGDAHDGRHECALQNCPACRSRRAGTVSIGVRRAHVITSCASRRTAGTSAILSMREFYRRAPG